MLFKYNPEAEFLTFFKSRLLKKFFNLFLTTKLKYILKIPVQIYYEVGTRNMKNTTSDLFCNADVRTEKLDVLSPNISAKTPTGTPV